MKIIAIVVAAALIGGAAMSAPAFAKNGKNGVRAKPSQSVLVNRIDNQSAFDPFHQTNR